VETLADGIHRFTARHPEWHPGDWGAEVACFAVAEGGRTLLVDPLVVDDEGWERLDGVVTGDVAILVTIPYHVRSAEAAAERYRGTVWGHAACAKRMGDTSRLRELAPGSEPAGVRAFAIGKPRRQEMPLLLERSGAVAFGDSVVGVPGREGPLRVWLWTDYTDRWYEQRYLPTLLPLAEAGPKHVLVTHGSPVIGDGSDALHRALSRKPWFHRG
jgi:hypothetical protein